MDKRDKDIIRLAKQGKTLLEIGNKYSITRERVRQLLERNGLNISIGSKNRKVIIHKFQCNNCDKVFYRKGNPPNKFCSWDCSGDVIHKINSEIDVKRKKVPSRNYPVKKYKRVYVGKVDGKSKYQLEHRLIMEKHLGRKLDFLEHVHHIDGNGLNNKIDNLEVIKAGEHGKTHNISWAESFKSIYLGKIKVARKNLYLYLA